MNNTPFVILLNEAKDWVEDIVGPFYDWDDAREFGEDAVLTNPLVGAFVMGEARTMAEYYADTDPEGTRYMNE